MNPSQDLKVVNLTFGLTSNNTPLGVFLYAYFAVNVQDF
jgi:hypothetical protein